MQWAIGSLFGLMMTAQTVIPSTPVGEGAPPALRAINDIYSLAKDANDILYVGSRGEIYSFDGHQVDRLPIPAADRILAMHVEEGRLWYGGIGGFGFAPLSDRVVSTPRRLRSPIEAPPVQTILSDPKAVSFGTSNGWLIRCHRPVEVDTECQSIRVPVDGYSIFSRNDGAIWAQVLGHGFFRFRGNGFELVSDEAPFIANRMPVHLPGRRAGEHLLGFYGKGLFWWTPSDGLEPVALGDLTPTTVYRGIRLPTGQYAIGTLTDGLYVFDARGQAEHFTSPTLNGAGVFRLLAADRDVVWVSNGHALQKLVLTSALRTFRLEREDQEFRGIQPTVSGAYVAASDGFYRLEPNASPGGQLRPIAPLSRATSLHVGEGRIYVATEKGLTEVIDGRPTIVWKSKQNVSDVATHPAHPDNVFVGLYYGVAILRRSSRGKYEAIFTAEVPAEATDLVFVSSKEAWFRSGYQPFRLVQSDGRWSLQNVDFQPLVGGRTFCYFMTAENGRLWMANPQGLLEFDPAAAAFRMDFRLSTRLGFSSPAPALTVRPDNPRTLFAGHARGGTDIDVFIGVRSLEQRADEADWQPVKPWFLDTIQGYHISRAVVGDRYLIGGVGQLVSIRRGGDLAARVPRRPIVRSLRSWTASSTRTRTLRDEGETLAWHERGIEIRYASPEHHPYSRIEFRTRIAQLGTNWSPWSTSPRRVFEALPRGGVTIEIQARDERLEVSPVRRLAFTVLPPWYLSSTATAGYLLGAVLFVGTGYTLSTRRLRARARRLKRELVERRKSEALARGQAQVLGRTLDGLSKRPELETFLREVLTSLRSELDADCVLLWTQDTNEELHPRMASPPDSDWQVLLPNAEGLVEPYAVGGTLWVPLVLGGQTEGVIGVFCRNDVGFSEPERYLAQSLGAQGMLAMQLAELASAQQQRAVFEERAALAREVHDSLAQGFVMNGIQLEQIVERVPKEERYTQLRADLMQALEVNRQGLVEARRCIRLLRAEGPDHSALIELLRGLESRAAPFGLGFRLEVNGTPSDPGPRISFQFYQIAYEAVSNVIRHAGAGGIVVSLDYRPAPSATDGRPADEEASSAGAIRLRIDDDGRGLPDGLDASRTMGISSMRERAAVVDGRLSLGPRPDGPGTRVEVTWSR